jgi:hypothetical protein
MEPQHLSAKTEGIKYTVSIPEKFRNEGWAESFGIIQQELRNLSVDIEIEIEIDFSKCCWADPLPMLSLLIALNEINTKYCNIKLILPNPKLNAKKSYEQRRFLAFIFREGFLDNFKDEQIIYPTEYSTYMTFTDNYKEKIINQYAAMLSYSDCTVLPAKIVDLCEIVKNTDNYVSDIEKEVERWVDSIKQRFNVANSLRKELLNKIDRFLKETIENVYEHAYPEDRLDEQKIVGCYIRYRKGLANGSLNDKSLKELDATIREESNKCPCLNKTFVENTSGFFEIFVVDAGVGLTNNFVNNREKDYVFREVWKNVVQFGERSNNNRGKNTEFGGLYTLDKLCKGGFLTARDSSDWVGNQLPLNKPLITYKSIRTETQISGLSLIGRLNAIYSNEKSEKWLNFNEVVVENEGIHPFLDAIQETDDLYTKYFRRKSSEVSNLFYIRDERNNNVKISKTSNCEFCLFLPPDRLPKNQIFSIVHYELGNINIKQRTIIIADIPVWEADIYQYALVNATGYKEDFINKIDTIILITRNLSVSLLTHHTSSDHYTKAPYNTYNYNKELTESFLLKKQETEFYPHRSLMQFVELIRTYDSTLYWTHIRESNISNEFFVNKEITWYQGGKDIGLSGYLNFAKTLTDRFCKDIYDLSLERTLCLSNNAGCEYESIDLLTKKLATQNNVLPYNVKKDNPQKISLGSVYVTGYTTRASQVGENANKTNFIIHFFHNQNVGDTEKATNPIPHLLLWPSEGKDWTGKKLNTNIPEHIQYRRIGTSYVIAPYGWKYFPIPRYKLLDKKNSTFVNNPTAEQIKDKEHYEFKSVYECTPKDTYRYWQGKGKHGQALSIGHAEYESNHDIFNIDFPFIVDESFMLSDNLSQFLLSEFLLALGIDEKGLIDNINQILQERVKNRLIHRREKKCLLILYPYHYNSEYIVSKIKMYIKKEHHNKIVALFPVNRERADATYLISPLTIETIRHEISKHIGSDIEVLLFDDATIEGKTRKEIKHTLFSLGVKNVRTLTLLERRRLPFSPSEPNYNKAFWRLDIPNLGSRDTCPICNALRKLSDIRPNIVANILLNRIKDVSGKWKQTSPEENSIEQLLTPTSIINENKVIKKKFGIMLDKDEGSILCGTDNEKIEIINSLGLSIYVSELHTMTSRDDIVLDFIKEPEAGKPIIDDFAKIEMLSTYLLLFKKEISNLTLEQIIKELFKLCKEKNESNYTSYALIALLNISTEKLNLLYNICKKEVGTDIDVQNIDMILLCFILSLDNDSNFSVAKSLKKYRKKDLKDIYSLFHSEIYNDNGIIHTVPLHLIAKNDASNGDFQNSIDSCKKLQYSINEGIPDWLYRKNGEDLDSALDSIKRSLTEYQTIAKQENSREKLLSLAQTLMIDLKSIHNKLFGCVGARDEESQLKLLIEELFNDKKLTDIAISSDFKNLKLENTQIERWIIWDSYVHTELAYLFHNAIKAGSDIKDPFCVGDNNDVVRKAWVTIKYDEINKCLCLLIYNKSDVDSATVKDETNKKMRYGKNHLSDLGIEVDYQSVIINKGCEITSSGGILSNDNKFLKTIILFPYI